MIDIPDFLRFLYVLKYNIYKVLNLKYYSIVDLQGRTGVDGEKIHIDSYYAYGLYPNSQRGGFKLVYKSSQAKSGHNGVTIHSPTVPFDGTQAGLAAYQAKTGETDSSGNGCWVLEYERLNVFMAGAVQDGSTDDATAIQNACNVVDDDTYALYAPSGTNAYKLGSTITVVKSVTLMGDGCSYQEGNTRGVKGKGTWFYIAHTGKGFSFDGTAVSAGILLRDIGTYRDQPTAGPGWTPTAHDYDIYIANSDIKLENIMLWNPTKGVYVTNGSNTFQRLEVDGLRGQPLETLIRIEQTYDVAKLNNVHIWAFWSNSQDVWDYMLANLDAIYLERCDNPMLSNIFTIFCRSGLRLGKNANGQTSKLHLVNGDFDRGNIGIWVDNTCTAVTAQFSNVTCQSELGVSGSKGMLVEGSGSTLMFSSFDARNLNENGIKVTGTGNKINIDNLGIVSYNLALATHEAVSVVANNTLRIGKYPNISGGGSGARYTQNGSIYVNEWRTWSPTITTGAGTITTIGAVLAYYKMVDNTVEFKIKIPITTNGTGSGDIRATLPVAVATDNSVGTGMEMTSSLKQLTVRISDSLDSIIIKNYDNTYPGADGYVLYASGSYMIA